MNQSERSEVKAMLAEVLSPFQIEVVSRLSVVETVTTDTKNSVEGMRVTMEAQNSRLSVGSEKFANLDAQVQTLKVEQVRATKDKIHRLWQVIGWVAPTLLSGSVLAYSILRS